MLTNSSTPVPELATERLSSATTEGQLGALEPREDRGGQLGALRGVLAGSCSQVPAGFVGIDEDSRWIWRKHHSVTTGGLGYRRSWIADAAAALRATS